MKRILKLIVLLAMLFQLGCATEEVRVASRQATMPVCCKSFAELPYEKLDTSSRVKITEQSPLYAFDEGKSFFKAYTLDEPKKIKIYSYYSVKSLISYIFKPTITFLDKNHVKTRTVFPRLTQAMYSSTEDYVFSEITMKSNERFIIIHTDDESYGDAFYHLYQNHKAIRNQKCGDPRVEFTITQITGVHVESACGNTGKDIPYGVIGEIGVQVQ